MVRHGWRESSLPDLGSPREGGEGRKGKIILVILEFGHASATWDPTRQEACCLTAVCTLLACGFERAHLTDTARYDAAYPKACLTAYIPHPVLTVRPGRGGGDDTGRLLVLQRGIRCWRVSRTTQIAARSRRPTINFARRGVVLFRYKACLNSAESAPFRKLWRQSIVEPAIVGQTRHTGIRATAWLYSTRLSPGPSNGC